MSTLSEEISRRRTFAIISHPDAGKTTLTEKFLLYGGAIAQAGVVKGWLSAPVGVVAGLQPEASSIAATRARHKICFIVFICFAPTYTQQAKRIPLGLLHKI